MISLTRMINKPDGSFGGIVAIQMDPDQFTRFYEHSEARPTDPMSVIGLDGITRARRAGSRVPSGENLSGMLATARQREHAHGDYNGPGERDGIVRYVRPRGLDHKHHNVTVGVDREDVHAQVGGGGVPLN